MERFASCAARSPPIESTDEEGDERDHRERVQPGEEDERDHDVAVGRVPVGAHVAPEAEDLDRGREADEGAGDEEER